MKSSFDKSTARMLLSRNWRGGTTSNWEKCAQRGRSQHVWSRRRCSPRRCRPREATEPKVGEDGSFSAGLRLRSYTRRERSAPDGSSDSNDFSVERATLFRRQLAEDFLSSRTTARRRRATTSGSSCSVCSCSTRRRRARRGHAALARAQV